MKRVLVEEFGGPEVIQVVDAPMPRPAEGEILVRVLASGVSFTDSQIRAGTYMGGPKPPFTPGYELVGVVEELGAGCSRVAVGDRVGVLTVWSANAEYVCVPEKHAVEVPEDLDPAEIAALIFTYMTAYQMMYRTARLLPGETVLVHGAAGRVGVAALEIGAAGGLRMIGTASAKDREVVEGLGATWIDYRNDDFLARVRELTDDGVDAVLDGIGGKVSLRSFRALRRGDVVMGDPGGRLVMIGRYNTIAKGRRDRRAAFQWWFNTVITSLWGAFSTRRHASGYRVQILRNPHQDWFQDDFEHLLQLLRDGKLHPVVAERLPITEARHAHELLESTAAKGKIVLVA
jgi:NADPH2:quinone reductase